MPLINGCNYQNPTNNGVLPNIPIPGGAPPVIPIQGDHLFGDVIGVIQTALQDIFGGGATWSIRMTSYNPMLPTLWTGLTTIDLGRGENPTIAQRVGVAENDEHSHMFGHYASRLQWQLCEVVCTGFPQGGGGEQRRIGGATSLWKNNVLASFDALMNNLVDSTGLTFYIATPNAIRQVNAAANSRHATLSLNNARQYANANFGPGKARVLQVLKNYGCLRGTLEGLLMRFDAPTKTFNNNVWN